MGPIDRSNDTLPTRFLQQGARLSQAPWLHLYAGDASRQTYSADELVTRARAWAATFRARTAGSARERPRVILILPHSFDLYAAFAGAWLAGAVPSIFAHPSEKTTPEDFSSTIRQLVAQVRPDLIVTAPDWRTVVAEAAGHDPRATITPFDVTPEVADVDCHRASPDDVAFVQYSSGTTGLKKGVAITHRAALWQIDRYGAAIALSPDDIVATWLPLYHDMGLVAATILPLVCGLPIVTMSPFDWVRRPGLLLEAIARHRATLCWLPNFAYHLLADRVTDRELAGLDLGSIRVLVNTSEPVRHESHRRFAERFRPHGLRESALASSYGMAEATFAITSGGVVAPMVEDAVDREALDRGRAVPADPGHPRRTVLVSCGTPLSGMIVRVLDSSGAALPDRHVGEIAITSPCVLDAYDGTGASVRQDGLFRTGDRGYLSNGHLFVTGRKKDLIIIAGRNIHPEDVEATVNGTPGIIPGRAVAFGVPDDELGTERAIVVAESTAAAGPDQRAIEDIVRARVAAAHDVALGDVCLVPARSLRKSTAGKLSRSINRDRYLARWTRGRTADDSRTAPTTIAADDGSSLAIARACVHAVLSSRHPDDAPVEDDAPLLTSGRLDSLSLTTLVVAVETRLGRQIPPTKLDVGYFESIARIARLIDGLASEGPERSQEAAHVIQVDDRDKACVRYLEATGPIGTLILGSSKAQHLSSAVALRHGHRAFNLWFRSARAEDWYCALRFVLDHPKGPLSHVVLALDVEGFSNAADLDIRLMYSAHLTRYLDDDQRATLPVRPVSTAADRRLDSVSVQLKLGGIETWMLQGSHELVTDRVGFAPGERPRLHLADPHDRDAQYVMRMAGFTALDPVRVQYFRRLVDLCRDRGIQIVSCVSPVHATLDACLSATTTYADRVNDLLALASTIDPSVLTCLDARVPARFGGFDDDFMNAAHIGPANSDVLLARLLQTVERLPAGTGESLGDRTADTVAHRQPAATTAPPRAAQVAAFDEVCVHSAAAGRE